MRRKPQQKHTQAKPSRKQKVQRQVGARKRLLMEGLEQRQLLAADILATTTVGSEQVLQGYDTSGALISSEVIPSGGAHAEKARDLVSDGGDIHVYNGTNTPYLSTLDSAGSWDHITTPGLSTFSSAYNGGIGKFENFVFLTDMWTGGSGSPKGIVRFDTDTGASTRFDNFYSYTDLTVGHDGLLYAQYHRTVRVYDPNSLELQRSIQLPFSINGQSQVYRGIAVDSSGEIYAASWQNRIHRFDSDGNVLESTTVSSPGGLFGDFTDIDLSSDGRLALGTYWGYIVQMNSDFTNTTYIDTGNSSVFVAFADQPEVPMASIADVQVVEGDLGFKIAQFNVSLSQPSDSPVFVHYETVQGTATAGIDYSPFQSAVGFFPGETSKTINIFVHGDVIAEDDENFEVHLTQAQNAGILDGIGVGTIVDDDAQAPLPELSVGNVTTNESNGSATFLVSLSAPSADPVMFEYATRHGTAQTDVDFTTTNGSVTIAPGQVSAAVSVNILDDVIDEMTESFYLDISNAQHANIADSSGFAFIYDDDDAFFSVEDFSLAEGNNGSTNANFAVSLSNPSAFTTRVDFATQDGTANGSSDYVPSSGQLTFAAGETMKTVSVPVNGDTDVEADEVFTLLLSSPFFAGIADGAAMATILNDDQSPVEISVGNSFGSEAGGQLSFEVTLSSASAQTVTVDYSNTLTQGDASAGIDFTATNGTLTFAPGETQKTIVVAVQDDNIDELTEILYVDLLSATGGTIQQGTGTGWIADDDTATLNVSDVEIQEGDQGSSHMVFNLSLSTEVSRDVFVDYESEDFTAEEGSDYQAVSGSLVFTPGQTQKTVSVIVSGDDVNEADELVKLNAEAIVNFIQNSTNGLGKIVNDDFPSITVGASEIVEPDSGTQQLVFTLTLSNPSETFTGVSYYTVDQTAVAGQDYSAAMGSIVFQPLQTSATISITILGDEIAESTEQFLLVLHQNLNAVLDVSSVTGEIIDDD